MITILCGERIRAEQNISIEPVSPEEHCDCTPEASDDSIPFLSTLKPYKPIYLVNTWFLDDEGSDQGFLDQEWLIQFSFKRQIFLNVFFAYSHRAFWQIYDQDNSRPFREHNYNPELFLEWYDLWSLDYLRFGLTEHESNGERQHYTDTAEPINRSRTWNRTYIFVHQSMGEYANIGVKLWTVTDSDDPDDGSFVIDNRDIQQYYGSGELTLEIGTSPLMMSILLRRGWMDRTETIQVDGRFPLHWLIGGKDTGLDLFLQAFSGYGDSLIDYNRKISRASFGFHFR